MLSFAVCDIFYHENVILIFSFLKCSIILNALLYVSLIYANVVVY